MLGKVRIVLEGLRGVTTVAGLCRQEGIEIYSLTPRTFAFILFSSQRSVFAV
ncbi:MAG: hypothetical protein ABI947_21560 [Chloroflexota bacterium]